IDKDSGIISHVVERTTGSQRNHRRARRLRLYRRNAEVFLARLYQSNASAVQIGELCIIDTAAKFDVSTCGAVQSAIVRSDADDHQLSFRDFSRLNRDVDALVWNECRD